MDEILAAVRAVFALQGATSESVAEALKKANKDTWQLIFDDGHGVALSQQQTKIDRLTNEKAALVAERDRLQGELATARRGTPEVAALQEQIEEKDEEIAKLKTDHQAAIRERDVNSALKDLRVMLASQLNENYEEVLVDRPATKRLLVHGEDGNLMVLRPGKTTPYTGDLEAQLAALAADLMKDVKPVWKRTKVSSGSGDEGEGGGGKNKAAAFDAARESAKKQTGTGGIENPEAELNRRLGLVSKT